MAAETGLRIDAGLRIDGTLYEVPPVHTFNMDEAQILYDYSGLSIEDFVRADDNETDDEMDDRLRPQLRNPGFWRALMHIAYQRAHPKTPAGRIKALVGDSNVISALETLGGEDDAVLPPASTTEPDESSPRRPVGSSESSGDDSKGGSKDGQVVPLTATGTSG